MTPTNAEALPNLVAIGVSADGIGAIHSVLGSLPSDFPAAVVLVMHRGPISAGALEQILARRSGLPVRGKGESRSKRERCMSRPPTGICS
jgi:chemotaxis response regulator CheB